MSRTNRPVDQIKAGVVAVADPRSSDLCLDCGLCCDGSIFGKARLRPDELELSVAAGLERVDDDGQAFFRLGCSCLDRTACRIYEKRPETCRTFRCALLNRLDTGDVDFMTAKTMVAEARRLADRADELNDRVENRADARERWYHQFGALLAGEARGSADQRADPAWLIAMTAFNRFLDRHFRHPAQRQIREDDGGLRHPSEERV